MFVHIALNVFKDYAELHSELIYRVWHNLDANIFGWHIRYQHVELVSFQVLSFCRALRFLNYCFIGNLAFLDEVGCSAEVVGHSLPKTHLVLAICLHANLLHVAKLKV